MSRSSLPAYFHFNPKAVTILFGKKSFDTRDAPCLFGCEGHHFVYRLSYPKAFENTSSKHGYLTLKIWEQFWEELVLCDWPPTLSSSFDLVHTRSSWTLAKMKCLRCSLYVIVLQTEKYTTKWQIFGDISSAAASPHSEEITSHMWQASWYLWKVFGCMQEFWTTIINWLHVRLQSMCWLSLYEANICLLQRIVDCNPAKEL